MIIFNAQITFDLIAEAYYTYSWHNDKVSCNKTGMDFENQHLLGHNQKSI